MEREGRLLEATRAHEERHRWREPWSEANRDMPWADRSRVEPEVIARAYVVAAEPEASPELIRAASVAARSHLVTRKPRPDVARQVDERVEELLKPQLPWLKEKIAQRREGAVRGTAGLLREKAAQPWEELREAQMGWLQERRTFHTTSGTRA